MLNCTQEINAAIAEGNHWIVYNETDVLAALPSRTKAREVKGENKIKQWDGQEQFNLPNGHAQHDDSIQGVIDGAEAAGLNVVVIDENTDFSKLDMAPPAGHVPARGPSAADVPKSESDKAFDNPHHGHHEDFADTEGEGFVKDMEQEGQSEFAKDKENMTTDPKPAITPIDPKKEQKVKPEVSHKSTVEKPTQLVHVICNMLYEANPDVTRKEIIAACTEAGIAHYTILTQYQAWKAARG